MRFITGLLALAISGMFHSWKKRTLNYDLIPNSYGETICLLTEIILFIAAFALIYKSNKK